MQGLSLIGARHVPHFWLQLISVILAVLIGCLFLRDPAQGLMTIALLLIVFFMIEGISKVVFAPTIRPFPNWGWVLASGWWGSSPPTLRATCRSRPVAGRGTTWPQPDQRRRGDRYLAWQVRQSSARRTHYRCKPEQNAGIAQKPRARTALSPAIFGQSLSVHPGTS